MNVLSVFDGKYEVCSNGSVFSNVGNRKELKGKIGKNGYRTILLTVNGVRVYKTVHRLVAECFIPNPENFPEVNHKDGIKSNNDQKNLEWCSSSHNKIHARDTGLHKTKLSHALASEIKKLYQTGNYSHRKLATMFGIGKTEIGYIIGERRWI